MATNSSAHATGHAHHNVHHFVATVGEHVSQTADGAKSLAIQVTKSAAFRAFRQTTKSKIGFHLPIPNANAAGNLRGMVISKKARTIYQLSSNVAKKFEKYDSALVFAGVILEVNKQWAQIKSIGNSKMSLLEKGRQIDLIVSTAALRSITGVVPTGAHLMAKSLEGYCEVAGLAGIKRASEWKAQLKATDVLITTRHSEIFSPEFMQTAGDEAFNLVETHIHFK
jgi:hypothetical protein